MRKLIFLIAIAFVLSTTVLVSANDRKGEWKDHGKMEQGMHHGKTEMVSSNDGGVIILMGGKLYKYDKNLSLVKTVEVGKTACRVEAEAQMNKVCPFHSKKECAMGMHKEMGKIEKKADKAPETKVTPPAKQNFGPNNNR